jgi:hypothetical protein
MTCFSNLGSGDMFRNNLGWAVEDYDVWNGRRRLKNNQILPENCSAKYLAFINGKNTNCCLKQYDILQWLQRSGKVERSSIPLLLFSFFFFPFFYFYFPLFLIGLRKIHHILQSL